MELSWTVHPYHWYEYPGNRNLLYINLFDQPPPKEPPNILDMEILLSLRKLSIALNVEIIKLSNI